MSKLDGDARGGAALSVKEVIGRPIAFASTGEKLNEFEQFHPDRMAGRILGMGDMLTLIEQAEQAFEKDEAEAAAEKLLEGEFTLDDFLEQMQQLKKMGPLGGLLGHDARHAQGAEGRQDRRRRAEAGRGDHPLDDAARTAQARADQRQPAHPHRQRQRHHRRRRQPAGQAVRRDAEDDEADGRAWAWVAAARARVARARVARRAACGRIPPAFPGDARRHARPAGDARHAQVCPSGFPGVRSG